MYQRREFLRRAGALMGVPLLGSAGFARSPAVPPPRPIVGSPYAAWLTPTQRNFLDDPFLDERSPCRLYVGNAWMAYAPLSLGAMLQRLRPAIARDDLRATIACSLFNF